MSAATQKIILFCATLAIIGGTAGALEHLKTNRRLGEPGIKAVAIPGQVNVEISLPANALDFVSTNVPTSHQWNCRALFGRSKSQLVWWWMVSRDFCVAG